MENNGEKIMWYIDGANNHRIDFSHNPDKYDQVMAAKKNGRNIPVMIAGIRGKAMEIMSNDLNYEN